MSFAHRIAAGLAALLLACPGVAYATTLAEDAETNLGVAYDRSDAYELSDDQAFDVDGSEVSAYSLDGFVRSTTIKPLDL